MSKQLKKIAPELGLRNFVRRLKQVVLPAPLGPISACTVPRLILRSTPFTARNPLNSFTSLFVSMTKDASGVGRPVSRESAIPTGSGYGTGAVIRSLVEAARGDCLSIVRGQFMG